MKVNLKKWLRIYYYKLTDSIAFYPALIAIGFVFLSWLMLELDFSPWGKDLKSSLSWLSLKDATTARSIISTVAGAIISLTVFSFSMVMIVLNQAASQMSNRVLTSMIENRFQQIVLGFYIGTIVYALFLLTTIRDIDSGIYVPALSIYLLIFLTVIDIFLFIYFLDYVTQTVKYETVINRVKDHTVTTMKKRFEEKTTETCAWSYLPFTEIYAPESNYFQNINEQKLLKIAAEQEIFISFLYKQTTFIVKGTPFIKVHGKEKIEQKCIDGILSATDLFEGQPIDKSPEYGFMQLAEIAIKALSPGINDPGTAVIAMHALADAFSWRLYFELPGLLKDETKTARISLPSSSFEALFKKCFDPIWNYGKNDEYIQVEILNTIEQLKLADYKKEYLEFFDEMIEKIERET